jgi:hypothetical protein
MIPEDIANLKKPKGAKLQNAQQAGGGRAPVYQTYVPNAQNAWPRSPSWISKRWLLVFGLKVKGMVPHSFIHDPSSVVTVSPERIHV